VIVVKCVFLELPDISIVNNAAFTASNGTEFRFLYFINDNYLRLKEVFGLFSVDVWAWCIPKKNILFRFEWM
jgi:hypothetical protein